MARLTTALLILLLTVPLIAGPVGIFEGELLDGPQAGWLYVKGRNGMLRRVQIAQARIVYGNSVPLERRRPDPSEGLIKGTVVKITAEQGADGEWRAHEVLLVHLGPTIGGHEHHTAELKLAS